MRTKYTPDRKGDAKTFGETLLLPVLLVLMFLATMWINDTKAETFNLQANHLRKNPDLSFAVDLQFNTDVAKIETVPYIEGGGYKNERIAYAWEISEDPDFIMTLNAENGAWTHDLQHRSSYRLCWTWEAWDIGILPNQVYCNSLEDRFYRTHYDHGFCGTSDGYYKDIYEDERFKNDWRWQMRECYRLYKGGTRMYGYNNRIARNTRRDGSKVIVFNQ